jgi:hypothetical protein
MFKSSHIVVGKQKTIGFVHLDPKLLHVRIRVHQDLEPDPK